MAVCDPGCRTCSSANPTLCSQCSSGYYIASGRCQVCPNSCLTCSSTNSTDSSLCLRCFSNYYLDVGVCLPCPHPCFSCSSSSVCSSCLEGFVYVPASSTCIYPDQVALSFNIQPIPNCASSSLTVSTFNSISCALCI